MSLSRKKHDTILFNFLMTCLHDDDRMIIIHSHIQSLLHIYYTYSFIHAYRGITIRRWKNVLEGDRCILELCLLANHITVHNEQKNWNFTTDDMQTEYQCFWVFKLTKIIG